MSAVSTNEAAVIAHFSRGAADSTASPNRYRIRAARAREGSSTLANGDNRGQIL